MDDGEHREIARLIGDLRRAERERDDLAATLETRNAEHAAAMARVAELATALAIVTAELDALRAQLAPLVACVDALRAAARAAGWSDADATGETLVAWVRREEREACARIADTAAAERERCARLCDEVAAERDALGAASMAARECAAHIRAGGV